MSKSTTQPTGSRVEVVEASSDRIVLALPAGGPKTRSLGIMALVWNGIMSWALVFLLFCSSQMALILIGLPFTTLFVAVGWFLAGGWIAMKFTRTNVLVTATEIATQKILFGFKDLDTTNLDGDSRARLVESFSSNDKAVYAVRVNGTDDTVSFGTALSRDDKDWIVATINDLLGTDTLAPARSSGDDDAEVSFYELDPSDLPVASVVSTLRPTPEQLILGSPSFPADQSRTYAIVSLLVVFLLWLGVGIWHCTIPGISHTIGGAAVLVLAAAPLVLTSFVRWGRITTTIDPNRLTTRYHIGWLGMRFRRPTHMAERVSVETSSETTDDNAYAGTLVQMGQSRLLAGWGTVRTCRQIAGLIRYHFRQLGIETTDSRSEHIREERGEA